MALSYKVEKKSFGFDKTKAEKYVAVAQRAGTVQFDRVVEQISLRTLLPKGITKSIIESLIDSMGTWMLEGAGVSLGELGILKPAITCKSSDKEGEQKIVRKRILFCPSKKFKSLIEKMELERQTSPGDSTGEGPLSPLEPGTGEGGEDGDFS